MYECSRVNKVVLTYISVLFGLLCKIMTSVHGYEQDTNPTIISGYTELETCRIRNF